MSNHVQRRGQRRWTSDNLDVANHWDRELFVYRAYLRCWPVGRNALDCMGRIWLHRATGAVDAHAPPRRGLSRTDLSRMATSPILARRQPGRPP